MDDMPNGLHGLVAQHGPVQYSILLNSKDSEDIKAASFLHECLHIYHDDFSSGQTADAIEAKRHAEMGRLLEIAYKEERL